MINLTHFSVHGNFQWEFFSFFFFFGLVGIFWFVGLVGPENWVEAKIGKLLDHRKSNVCGLLCGLWLTIYVISGYLKQLDRVRFLWPFILLCGVSHSLLSLRSNGWDLTTEVTVVRNWNLDDHFIASKNWTLDSVISTWLVSSEGKNKKKGEGGRKVVAEGIMLHFITNKNNTNNSK